MKLLLSAMTLFVSSVSATAFASVECQVTSGDVDFGNYQVISKALVRDGENTPVQMGGSTFMVYTVKGDRGTRVSIGNKELVTSGFNEVSLSIQDSSLTCTATGSSN